MRRHGHARDGRRGRSPEYHSWQSMVARCERPTHPRFDDYGGRGIRICACWRHDFAAFLADMGPRPANRTLDRIDVEGDYTPENCRWADHKTQRWNQRGGPMACPAYCPEDFHEAPIEEPVLATAGRGEDWPF